jgi:DNA invertase Pin-like site-specific DNA recombinase
MFLRDRTAELLGELTLPRTKLGIYAARERGTWTGYPIRFILPTTRFQGQLASAAVISLEYIALDTSNLVHSEKMALDNQAVLHSNKQW